MHSLSIHYGFQIIFLPIPDTSSLDTIFPPDDSLHFVDGQEIINAAISNPLTEIDLNKLRKAKTISIGINDKTRPVPYDKMVPPVLDLINKINPNNPQVIWISATGTHTPLTPEELDQLLPQKLRGNTQIISHNCDDEPNLTFLGTTQAGTPIKINKTFLDADFKILLGSIEPHHFMGYSGGVKTAVIGLAARKTIRFNHAMLTSPLATTASFDTNPCRVDVEEMGRLIGIDLCLNVVMDAEKQIRAAFFGDPYSVMTHGIQYSQKISQVSVKNKYQLVIVSCGGYPKDINLYQAQKAVSNAAMITADGGEVILFAECREGHGSKQYFDFMQGIITADEVLEKFNRNGFEIGPHKAYLIARQLKRIKISVVSNMSDELPKSLLLDPISRNMVGRKIQGAQKNGSRVAFMPYGVSTVPRMEEDHD